MASLFIFGFGYTAEALANYLRLEHWEISGTSRNPDTRTRLQSDGYAVVDFEEQAVLPHIKRATHLLISTPLSKERNDPVLQNFRALITNQAQNLEWIGYLSTTGVYGDHQGAWVDESTAPTPSNARTTGRKEAEEQWWALGSELRIPTHIFRLAGIYGRGKNALRQLKDGTARPIYKEGQVFSRIHVDDIANIITASIKHAQGDNIYQGGNIYNVCDDLPAPAHEVILYAARLLNITAPELIPFAQAKLSEIGREFYESSRRVKNDKVKNELNVKLMYPTYREGLSAILKSGDY